MKLPSQGIWSNSRATDFLVRFFEFHDSSHLRELWERWSENSHIFAPST